MSKEPISSFEFSHNGREFLARVYRDDDMSYPWKEHDGHGLIREAQLNHRGYTRKRGGEVAISTASHLHSSVWLYDVAGTIKKAIAEGWGLSDADMRALELRLDVGRNPDGSSTLTRKEIAAEAVRKDMERMRAWLADEWQWVGVSVVMKPDYSAAIEALEAQSVEDVYSAIATLRDLQDDWPEDEYTNAVWGTEGDNEEHLRELAREIADEIGAI